MSREATIAVGSIISGLVNAYTCYGLRRSKEKFRVALLTAYFDETGVHGEGVCVVAGFVGNDAQWLALAADWISAVKPSKNLHMNKLRWKQHPTAVASRIARLGPIPHKYNLRPVYAGLKWGEYNSILKPKNNSEFVKPYVLCSLCAIDIVLTELAEGDDVLFVFDRQEGKRRIAMDELRTSVFENFGADRRVRDVTFLKREDTVCLDPADYLAYIIREVNLDPYSFKSQAGSSILGKGGNGGWIPPHHLETLANISQEGFGDAVREIMESPYFRGPVQQIALT
jgi:hypothetical protein